MSSHYSLRQDLNLLEATTREARLETVPLPYGEKDLEPVMSRTTLDYHYDKLAKGYAQRYNRGEGDRDFNRAGSFLHNKFFVQFRPPKASNRPKGTIADIIDEKYDTWEDFQRQFKGVAMDIQGSGWIYLSTSGDIKTIVNHAVRTDIALLVDWWEHAWALDYHSQKDHYLHNLWKIINWDVINERI